MYFLWLFKLYSSIFLKPDLVFYKIFHILMRQGKERNTVANGASTLYGEKDPEIVQQHWGREERGREELNFSYAHKWERT